MFFYTCYTEKAAVEYSLASLFKSYPDCPVYLVSDGGEDYEYLTQQFSSLTTTLESDSRGFIPNIPRDVGYLESEWQTQIKASILTFLDRISRAIDYHKRPWTLVMEPDVLIRGKLAIPANATLCGSCINQGLAPALRELLARTEGAIDVNTWGATPALFNSATFKLAHARLLDDVELFDALCKAEPRLPNYDILLPVVFGIIGHSETLNPDITECFRNPGWETSWHPLLHQYRAKYPTAAEGYSGTHVKHNLGLGDAWPWKR